VAARKKINFNQDITKHYLVNPAKILNESETKKLLDQYNISSSQLPVISVKDPLSKSLEAKEGDIIEISRTSNIAGSYQYYRRVL